MIGFPHRGQFGIVVARRGGKKTMLVPVVVAAGGWPTRPAAPRDASSRLTAGGLEGGV
jgi:hypothetical protein